MRERAWLREGKPLDVEKLQETYTGTKKKSASSGSNVRTEESERRARWMATSAAKR